MTTTLEAAPVRVVVAGTGNIARNHYLPFLSASDKMEVVGLWERDAAVAAEVAAGWPAVRLPKDAEQFGGYLARVDAHLLVNLTPPSCHHDLTRAALDQGVHVFSEKPLGLTTAEAEDLVALAAERDVWLSVAPYVTGCPLLDAVRGVLDSGELGHVHTAFLRYGCSSDLSETSSGWRADGRQGGVLVDVGSYPLAMLDRLFGPPKRLASWARSAATLPTGTAMESWTLGLSYGPATHAVVQTGSHFAASGFRLDLHLTGTVGELKVVGGNLMSLEYQIHSRAGDGWRTVRVGPTDYHWARGPVELAALVRMGEAPQPPHEALGHVQTVQACREQARGGEEQEDTQP